MSDFLSSLVGRSLGIGPTVKRREFSLFEQGASADLGGHVSEEGAREAQPFPMPRAVSSAPETTPAEARGGSVIELHPIDEHRGDAAAKRNDAAIAPAVRTERIETRVTEREIVRELFKAAEPMATGQVIQLRESPDHSGNAAPAGYSGTEFKDVAGPRNRRRKPRERWIAGRSIRWRLRCGCALHASGVPGSAPRCIARSTRSGSAHDSRNDRPRGVACCLAGGNVQF